ncbi:MAG: c-type cytochrome biogenesis protein CcmI, partial [Pseudomonadota bacterium]
MTLFIAISVGVALVTGLLMVLPMLQGGRDAPVREDFDTALFRDQLTEIDRDQERGTITPAEAEGARAEISRRLLAASKAAGAKDALASGPRMSSGMVAGLSLLAVPIVAAGVYLGTGEPGEPDQPLAERTAQASSIQAAETAPGRPNQAQAEAETPAGQPAVVDEEYARLIARLEQRLETTPNDPQGLRLLANGYMRLERYGEAWRTYDRLIQILGAGADPDLYANMAEGMVLAAGGYVSPEAERALGEALRRNPRLPVARYYAGLSLAQNGMLPEAIRVWEALAAETPEDAPWKPWLDQMLSQATEFRDRGMPGLGAPSEAEIAAADAMSEEERMDMVMGMVTGLEERLL